MQTWEYKAIVERDHQRAEAAINKAGEEGWEAFAALVWPPRGMVAGPKAGEHLIWMKRPRQP